MRGRPQDGAGTEWRGSMEKKQGMANTLNKKDKF